MKTSILKTNLAQPLASQLDEHGYTKTALAEKIGVSPQKLTAMMSDQWEYITRDALERTADFLRLDVSQVFELVPVPFWDPIEEGQSVLLRGSQQDTPDKKEVYVPRYDDEATQIVKSFLRKSLPDWEDPPVAEHHQDEEEVVRKARTQNCIVVGSPKNNAATEILLSRFFGAVPFTSSKENRRKIPFGFCWPDDSLLVKRSSLTCSEIAREEVQGRPGIAVRGGIHIPADYKPPEEFRKWKTKEGLDCGLVLVANQPFGTKQSIKLIVLAGFAGMGTLAAAKALVQDFRYLEPVGEEKCVFGVVEGKYRKAANTNDRELRSFGWRYREGGHAPINRPKEY